MFPRRGRSPRAPVTEGATATARPNRPVPCATERRRPARPRRSVRTPSWTTTSDRPFGSDAMAEPRKTGPTPVRRTCVPVTVPTPPNATRLAVVGLGGREDEAAPVVGQVGLEHEISVRVPCTVTRPAAAPLAGPPEPARAGWRTAPRPRRGRRRRPAPAAATGPGRPGYREPIVHDPAEERAIGSQHPSFDHVRLPPTRPGSSPGCSPPRPGPGPLPPW